MTKDVTEPNKEPTVNRTPSPRKRNVKAKRLLPMELRKRRRAAKLQVSAEKKAKVSLEAAPSPQTPLTPGRSPSTAAEKQETATDSVAETPIAKKTLPPAATRLHSLYASSSLSQKQRRRLIPGANVPNTFQDEELPLDIVPKIKLSILTVFPYPFQRLNSKIKTQALQHFISGNQSTSRSPAVRWQQALHYFVHPADSIPTSILVNRASAANTSEPLLGGPKGERKREEKTFFTTRWNTWQEAFRDLYMNFRRHASSRPDGDTKDGSFYLCSSEFVVYFLNDTDSQGSTENGASIIKLCRQHDEETGASEESTQETKCKKNCTLRAVMSQSSARIRKILHHLNVSYTMPYIKANQTQREVGEFHLLEEELEASRKRNKDRNGGATIAPVTSAASVPENMHGADSLLLFHGHGAVHGLYEFLINRAPMSNQDVPELYALYPFVNASIQSLQVRSFGRVGAASESLPEDQPSKSLTLFRIEILGFCFPSSVVKLLAVLKDEWEATNGSLTGPTTEELSKGGKNAQVAVRTYMEAMAGAERLNAVKLDEQVTQESGGDQQERQKRQQELEFSKRRMEVAVVTRVESRYDVETTTRPIVVRR